MEAEEQLCDGLLECEVWRDPARLGVSEGGNVGVTAEISRSSFAGEVYQTGHLFNDTR